MQLIDLIVPDCFAINNKVKDYFTMMGYTTRYYLNPLNDVSILSGK